MRRISILILIQMLASCSPTATVPNTTEEAIDAGNVNSIAGDRSKTAIDDTIPTVPVIAPESSLVYTGAIPAELSPGNKFSQDDWAGHMGPDQPRRIPGWIYTGGGLVGGDLDYAISYFEREGSPTTLLLLTVDYGSDIGELILDTKLVSARKYETQFDILDCDLSLTTFGHVIFYNAQSNTIRAYVPQGRALKAVTLPAPESPCVPMGGE